MAKYILELNAEELDCLINSCDYHTGYKNEEEDPVLHQVMGKLQNVKKASTDVPNGRY